MPWMAIVGVAMAAASAVTGAIGSIQKGNQAAAADKFNEMALLQKAETDKSVAAAQAGQQQLQTRGMVAAEQAAYGAAGVTTAGSPLLVMADTARQGSLKAALTQWQGQTQANTDTNQAALYSMQANQARSSATLGAGMTLLTGASSAAASVGQMYAPGGYLASGSSAGTSPMAGGSYGATSYTPGPQSLI